MSGTIRAAGRGMVDGIATDLERETLIESNLKVVTADDETRGSQGWAESVDQLLKGGSSVELLALNTQQFGDAVAALRGRAVRAKAGQGPSDDAASVFDGADIVVLDSDLTPDPDADLGGATNESVGRNLAGETGSEVARLARAHSTV